MSLHIWLPNLWSLQSLVFSSVWTSCWTFSRSLAGLLQGSPGWTCSRFSECICWISGTFCRYGPLRFSSEEWLLQSFCRCNMLVVVYMQHDEIQKQVQTSFTFSSIRYESPQRHENTSCQIQPKPDRKCHHVSSFVVFTAISWPCIFPFIYFPFTVSEGGCWWRLQASALQQMFDLQTWSTLSSEAFSVSSSHPVLP